MGALTVSLPRDSVVCLADVRSYADSTWYTGDLDVALRPFEDMGRYLGSPVTFDTRDEHRPTLARCDYYYRSPVCGVKPALGDNSPTLAGHVARLNGLCAALEGSATLRPLREQTLRTGTINGLLLGDGRRVTVALYAVAPGARPAHEDVGMSGQEGDDP